MNRFAQAALTDEELAQFVDRFAKAAQLLKVDEVKFEHKEGDGSFTALIVPQVTLMLRLGERWLGTDLDWMVVENMRAGNFDNVSRIAMTMAQMLRDGHGAPIDKFMTVNRFAGVAGELGFGEEKP